MRLFVTGTDTGVGKTVVAAGLARLLDRAGQRVAVLKPVETGCGEGGPADGRLLGEAVGVAAGEVVPVTYREPLAPLVAAREEGRPVDLDRLDRAMARLASFPWLLVEGAGGLSVPLTDDLDMAGLARRWHLPLLVVARPGLGTLNHTVLTVRYAESEGLEVLGVVVSGWPEGGDDPSLRTNLAMIEELSGRPVLGVVPRREPMVTAADAATAVAASGLLDGLALRAGSRGASSP